MSKTQIYESWWNYYYDRNEYIYLWCNGERLWKLYFINEYVKVMVHCLTNNEKIDRIILISGLDYEEDMHSFTVRIHTLKEFDRYMVILGLICGTTDVRYNRGQVEFFYKGEDNK